MAITLDELLGRNTREAVQNSTAAFPSYEDFKTSRMNQAPQAQPTQAVRYNFDMAPAREVRSTESVRNYEASRPYVAPQSSEYQNRDYPIYDSLQQRAQYAPVQPVQYQSQPYQAPVQTYDQVQYAQPQVQPMPAQTHEGFYEFTAQDSERASDQELYARLAHTNMSNTPVFEDSAQQTVKRTGLFARKAQKTQDMSEQKQRARLNTKGKIILGVYLAVIALVASLSIVNATKINQGKAVTPTSEFKASMQANNTESFEIDSKYEVRI